MNGVIIPLNTQTIIVDFTVPAANGQTSITVPSGWDVTNTVVMGYVYEPTYKYWHPTDDTKAALLWSGASGDALRIFGGDGTYAGCAGKAYITKVQ